MYTHDTCACTKMGVVNHRGIRSERMSYRRSVDDDEDEAQFSH